jgi:hypothetical protein
MKKAEFTGICVCGHKWEEHHISCILNAEALENMRQSFRSVDGCLGDECEATQFEGFQFKKPECHCSMYWDKGWPPDDSV